ncbi:transposon Tf2-8 polyprotein [Trichonephila clavipes]|nr:transposon Tf2-8 polyprotein [Trichonephila clavipes]
MSVCTGKIKFLGYEITQGHYSPSNPNIETIRKLAPPKDVKELQRFLGSINVYQKFIKDYAKLRVPLNKLLKKDAIWNWSHECQEAYQKLKDSLISKPILKLYNSQYPCHVFCDASQDSIGVVLKQQHPDGTLYPIAYHSRQLLKHEKNYTISEKECLAIIDALDKFHCYLHGSKFTIHTDHAALQWLKSVKHLTGRLFRWSLKLSQYEYSIVYIKEQVTYEYNNSPHDVTGFPPAYLMFGTLPYDSPLPNQVKLNYPPIQQARQIAKLPTVSTAKCTATWLTGEDAPCFPKAPKGTALNNRNSYTNVYNSIIRPNVSYAQAANPNKISTNFNSQNKQPMAPKGPVNSAQIEANRNPSANNRSIPNFNNKSNNNFNGYNFNGNIFNNNNFNLQATLQMTMQCLCQLSQFTQAIATSNPNFMNNFNQVQRANNNPNQMYALLEASCNNNNG